MALMFRSMLNIVRGMDILLCNDDGIHARGIRELYQSILDLGKLHVVAPDRERSAAGHAITISDPIKTLSVDMDEQYFGTSVSGTPADCIKLALCKLLKGTRPDLVVSGINLGPNTGISVLYSGTVSAATEAVIIGVPGIALSLCTYQDPHWDTAAKVAHDVVEMVLKNPMPPGTLLNVNIPNLPLAELKGMKAARMGRSRFIEKFVHHNDPRGNDYYWLDGDMSLLDETLDADIRIVEAGYVALTPIQIDMTAHHLIDHVTQWNVDY
jgi:5'-nucleotidase